MDSTTHDEAIPDKARTALQDHDRRAFKSALRSLSDRPQPLEALAGQIIDDDIGWAAHCLFEQVDEPSIVARAVKEDAPSVIEAAVETDVPMGRTVQALVEHDDQPCKTRLLAAFSDQLKQGQPLSNDQREALEALGKQPTETLVELFESDQHGTELALVDELLSVLASNNRRDSVEALLAGDVPTDDAHAWYQSVPHEPSWASLIVNHVQKTAAPHRQAVPEQGLVGLARTRTDNKTHFQQVSTMVSGSVSDRDRRWVYRAVLQNYKKEQLGQVLEWLSEYFAEPMTADVTAQTSLLSDMARNVEGDDVTFADIAALGGQFEFDRPAYATAFSCALDNAVEEALELLRAAPVDDFSAYSDELNLSAEDFEGCFSDAPKTTGAILNFMDAYSRRKLLEDAIDSTQPQEFSTLIEPVQGDESVFAPVVASAVETGRMDHAGALIDHKVDPETVVAEDLSDAQRRNLLRPEGTEQLRKNLQAFFEHFAIQDDEAVQAVFQNVLRAGTDAIGDGYEDRGAQSTIKTLNYLRHEVGLEPPDFDDLYRVLCYRAPVVPPLMRYLLRWEPPSRPTAQELFIDADTSNYEAYEDVFYDELSDRQIKFLEAT